MNAWIYLLLALASFYTLGFLIPASLGAYIRYRGNRLVRCPETCKPVGVQVDATHAALTAIFHRPSLRLNSCTRWPEKKDCGQECLLQVELAPEDCLIRNILVNWYAGKKCVYCARPFEKTHSFDNKPALMNPDGVTVEWHQISAEGLLDVLTTHKPVCFNCHIAETFRRDFPELVIDRSYAATDVGKPKLYL